MTITLTGIEGEMIITLTGMMGCGKSSIGRELSRLLSLPFVDLDDYIEEREGRSIRDIFESEGEASFRKMELEALREILFQESASEPNQDAGEPGEDSPQTDYPQTKEMILALGGGTLTTPECAELVAEHTFCIYLKTSADELFRRLESESATRPMLNSNTATSDAAHRNVPIRSSEGTPQNSSDTHRQQLHQRITKLLSQREPIYEKTARRTIATDGLSISQIAAAIANSAEQAE